MPVSNDAPTHALKADSFGRILLVQGPEGPFVRRDLGATPGRAFLDITLPLIRTS